MINWNRLVFVSLGMALGWSGIIYHQTFVPAAIVWAALLLED